MDTKISNEILADLTAPGAYKDDYLSQAAGRVGQQVWLAALGRGGEADAAALLEDRPLMVKKT